MAEGKDAVLESDQAPGCPSPRDTYALQGHEAQETEILEAMDGGHMHHAWLLVGPKGIGKATLAYRMARRVLGARPAADYGVLGAAPDDPVCARIAALSHSDFLLLRRPYDEKRKRWRAEITADEARRISTLFETRAAEGGWRVCVIDSADDMNMTAANAILKTLEEPPEKSLIILVSQSPGLLPATIRSRCRRLDMRSPSVETAIDIVKAQGVDAHDAALAVELAAAAPGRAMQIAALNGAGLWRDIERFFSQLHHPDDLLISDLTRRLGSVSAAPARALFFDLLVMRIDREIRARGQSGQLGGLENWFLMREEVMGLINEAGRIYLDPEYCVYMALSLITRAHAQNAGAPVSPC